jgi:hypothetical protein
VHEGEARVVGGARKNQARAKSKHARDHESLMLFFSKHTRATQWGDTKVITLKRFRKMQLSDGDFLFAVNVASDKAERQLGTDWEALSGHPVEPIARKYRIKSLITDTIVQKPQPFQKAM